MKVLIGMIAAVVLITSAFAAGTADNVSDIQNKRTEAIDAAVNL